MLHEIIIPEISDINDQIIQVPASEVPESEISVEISSEPLYCLCQEPWDIHNRKFMIHCDHCSDWFHGLCVGITDEEAKDIEKYHCPKCHPEVGPSVLVDYTTKKINKRVKSVRCTPEFIEKLQTYKFLIPDEVVLKVRGQALTLPWLIAKGFTRPVFVDSVEALGMKLPPDSFTVRDVERYVGSDRMVDVIDVERQTDILMSMQEFADYFMSPNRNKLLNLISLEFTHTNLNKLVESPAISRKLDWVTNYWPSSQPSADEESILRPTVQKYCLISSKDSYTDFHIDFGGTSVWYHVLWGEKVFYFIEPSEANLNIYSRWMDGEMGDNCFLADEIPVCFRCVLKKGQTLLIPTGWIHAVYTPEDSLVFGGNFLHFLNMDLQLQVYDIEKRLQTPVKYLFPSFEATHWYAAEGLIQNLQTLNATSYVPGYMIKGLKALIQSLKIGKVRREYIPGRVNCKRIIHDLCKELRSSEKRLLCSSSKDNSPLKESVVSSTEFPVKEILKRDSNSVENGYTVSGTSPTTGTSKDPLKLVLSISSSATVEATQPKAKAPGRITMTFKRQSVSGPNSGEDSSRASSPKDNHKQPRVKIRLSLSDRKSESIDYDSTTGSDVLHIAESDHDITKLDSDGSSQDLIIDLNRHKGHRKHHHKKCKKGKTGKSRNDQNRSIDEVLAGTLDGLEELFQSSNYSERISQSESTSQAIKDTVAGMSAMKETILPSRKKSKHKKRKHGKVTGSDSDDMFEGIEKVHQDDDYIYLPLAGSDDDAPTNHGKSKRGKRKVEDESWSPRAKVGPVGHRETKSSRVNAKREAVEKGLEKASAALESAKRKKKHEPIPILKVKKQKLTPSPEKPKLPSTSSSMDIATKTSILAKKFADISTPSQASTTARKPKKGMATVKQRLGKILKLNKFARF
ncbi:Histone lysine demethylase PHF8 [Folsomia candida]|uniref:Histone lysine demethylase PHF8 n=1 Tax=Folsomia candida TaxID=158441 RepID=A0A226E4K4_FOLCA|nr:Histone lysine demethylase PHF8 [Folsomia candida]